jgi:hypothetical protein
MPVFYNQMSDRQLSPTRFFAAWTNPQTTSAAYSRNFSFRCNGAGKNSGTKLRSAELRGRAAQVKASLSTPV